MVHRLLACAIGLTALPSAIEDREAVRSMADNINFRHRMAQLVSRASSELYTLVYFTRDTESSSGRSIVPIKQSVEHIVGTPRIEEALIVTMKSTGFRVMVPRYGLEGAITLHRDRTIHRADDVTQVIKLANPYHFNSDEMSLQGPKGKFQVFQSVQVKICVKEKHRRRWLSMELYDPKEEQEQREQSNQQSKATNKQSKKPSDTIKRTSDDVADLPTNKGNKRTKVDHQ